ncbi:MAG: hypothetical protein HC820_05825 [Hydrococcus sp. RM1_1_31]|nr:hypothetical protein [Hydrococcus sp. RM1_1_31]
MASGGYPGEFQKGFPISGLNEKHTAHVFHAGTKVKENSIVNDGGRVLGITATGATLAEAREKAYKSALNIGWEGVTFRNDIGTDLLKLL